MDEINCTLKKQGGYASRILLCLCLLGGLFLSTNSSAQPCPAPTPCPNAPGQIIADGNPCEWGLNNLNTFAIKSYRLDAFGNGVNDSSFTEGSKDFFFADQLAWTYGQTKAKNDIANGAAVLIGSTLYFAGDRTSNNGAAQIGFWFYLNGTGPTTQADGTQNFAPPHAVGDLFVLADFTSGGRLATVTVLSWVGTGGNVVGSNGTLNTTNCAGIVAQNNDTRYLIPQGWSFIRGCYDENEFYEGQIDLSCLSGNTPSLCFSSFLLETRSSHEITASLDDFVSGAFGGRPAVPTVTPASRCGDGSVTLTAACTVSNVRWYSAASGGSPLVTGGGITVNGGSLTITNLTATTSYWASCYNADLNCESDRVQVTATRNSIPSCTFTSSGGNICPNSTRVYTGPAGVDTYLWTITGNGTIPNPSTGSTVTVTSGTCGTYTLTLRTTIG
ncbi:MAG TPA: hypothetical protein VK498_03750, partial [Ferruginibacter sp.]|nr:hypothetical protein [Ferruginibacter sp.]